MLEGPTKPSDYIRSTRKRTEQNDHKTDFCLLAFFFLLSLFVAVLISIGCVILPYFSLLLASVPKKKCAQEFKRRKWSCGTNVERPMKRQKWNCSLARRRWTQHNDVFFLLTMKAICALDKWFMFSINWSTREHNKSVSFLYLHLRRMFFLSSLGCGFVMEFLKLL